MELGFIGTGTITAAIVTGLGADFAAEGHIHLSPRNAATAVNLAATFPNVHVAESNQMVLDRSEVVILAVRPQVAKDVIAALAFRPDHHVISLVATYSEALLTELVRPAARLTKAVPLPAVAMGRSPTAIYPPDPVAAALFGRMGVAIEVDRPEAFDALTTVTATMASYFTFAGTIADWLTQHGLPELDARRYVASIFDGLAATAGAAEARSFAVLAEEHATKGGINEDLVSRLTGSRVFDAVQDGLDAVLARIEARLSR